MSIKLPVQYRTFLDFRLRYGSNELLLEKENINTMDSKGEVMLTIMASLAQQEYNAPQCQDKFFEFLS